MGTDRKAGREAAETLDLIRDAEASGALAGRPPWWMNLVIALMSGGIVGFSITDRHVMVSLMITGIAVAIATGRSRTGAMQRSFPQGLKGVIALSLLIAWLLAIFIVSALLFERSGIAWAPWAGGGIVALSMMIAGSPGRAGRREGSADT